MSSGEVTFIVAVDVIVWAVACALTFYFGRHSLALSLALSMMLANFAVLAANMIGAACAMLGLWP